MHWENFGKEIITTELLETKRNCLKSVNTSVAIHLIGKMILRILITANNTLQTEFNNTISNNISSRPEKTAPAVILSHSQTAPFCFFWNKIYNLLAKRVPLAPKTSRRVFWARFLLEGFIFFQIPPIEIYIILCCELTVRLNRDLADSFIECVEHENDFALRDDRWRQESNQLAAW